MTVSKTSEYFFNAETFKHKYKLMPYMIRMAGAKILPINCSHANEEILNILNGPVK